MPACTPRRRPGHVAHPCRDAEGPTRRRGPSHNGLALRGSTRAARVSAHDSANSFELLGDAPIKVQQDRKKLAEGHFNISTTKRVSLENSTDLGRGAAPELKSVEFSVARMAISEKIVVTCLKRLKKWITYWEPDPVI